MIEPGFITKLAAAENAIDLVGPWTSHLPGFRSGGVAVFEHRGRTQQVVSHFGPIAGWKVLELGSFEGGYTSQLAALGADVLGIEADGGNFLRSLVAQNQLGFRARFLLGDFVAYLRTKPERFDLIFASGVLYHMADPVELLRQIAAHTDRALFWTLYVGEEHAKTWPQEWVFDHASHGFACRYFRFQYDPAAANRSYCGTDAYCSRMRQAEIFSTLERFGMGKIKLLEDAPNNPGGPAMTFTAER